MRFLRIDRFGTPLGDVEGVLEARRKRDVGGTDMLELTMTGPLEKDDRVVARDSKGRWCEWICTSPQGERKDNVPPYGTCVLQGSVRELSRKMHVEVRNRNATARDALTRCLEGTRWEVGTIDVSTTASVSYYHETAYQSLLDLCKAFECEYEASYVVSGNYVTRRIISLYDRRGSASVAHRFEYGRDLPGIVRTVADDDVVTRLYGYGKGTPAFDEAGDFTGGYHRRINFADINGGKEYVENTSLISTWGMMGPNGTLVPAEGVVFFNDCEDPAELLALTRKELERHSAPIVEYECDVLALARAGEDFEGADIGDAIRVVDSSFPVPVRIEARVLKIEELLTDGIGGIKLTIGNATETYTQRTTAALQTLQDLESMYKAWNEAAGSFPTYLNQVLLGLNTTINDSGGWTYLVPGLGLVTYDVEVSDPAVGAEASMVTEMRGGALRFANSRDSSGNWEFRTVLVPGHVAADMVTAGYITAGYIRDQTGGFFIDLDNHEYSLPGSTTVGGKTIAQAIADNLTQQEVFDALTNNGALQGLFMQGGELYINATYINSGYLSANRIQGGTLKVGGANNVNGVFEVLDESGNVISKFDKDGAQITGQVRLVIVVSSSLKVAAEMGSHTDSFSTWYGNKSGTLYGLKVASEHSSSSSDNAIFIIPGNMTSSTMSAGLIVSRSSLVLAGETANGYGASLGLIKGSTRLSGGAGSGSAWSAMTLDGRDIQFYSWGGSSGYLIMTLTNSNGLTLQNDFYATGSKNRLVETEHYGKRPLSAYETASPTFGDIGSGTIAEDGICCVSIDPIFAETARTDLQYQVFCQKCGPGDLWVSEKHADHFVIEGTPGLAFDWEIKARQLGYESQRMEDYDLRNALGEDAEAIANEVAEQFAGAEEYVREVQQTLEEVT